MRHLAAAVYTCANSSISNVERRADGSAAESEARACCITGCTYACMYVSVSVRACVCRPMCHVIQLEHPSYPGKDAHCVRNFTGIKVENGTSQNGRALTETSA